jgi:Asp-tRNA(Asn)/Glu-tRNA(Gln) amidotransferase A subunit family amidase
VKKKKVKPAELVEAAIERIERHNPQLNAGRRKGSLFLRCCPRPRDDSIRARSRASISAKVQLGKEFFDP